MSDDNAAPHLRILPQTAEVRDLPELEGTVEDPTPDEITKRPLTEAQAVEIKDEEPDTDGLLDKIIDGKIHNGKAGRPAYNIDERVVAAMAKVGGTLPEIAAHFGCSERVLTTRFAEVIATARASRKIRLRQKQYQVALEGNVGMLIWLGKQELGQIDESRVRVGDLSRFSDEELEQIAAGKLPGQLGAGKREDEEEK